jgi:hypothetical protein
VGPIVLALGGGHEFVPAPLLVLFLLLGVVARAALIGVLLPLPLGLQGAEDGSNRLLTGDKVGGNVQQFLGGAGALVPQLMD